MNEDLLQHIRTSTKREYFPDDYNHFVGIAYTMIGGCAMDDASKLKLNLTGFTVLKGEEVIDMFRLDNKSASEKEHVELVKVHRMALDKILSRDVVVQKYTRIIKDTPDEIIIEFIEPAKD